MRKHSAKERGAQDQTGGDFPAYQGLTHASEQVPEYAGYGDDHNELNYDDQQNVLGLAAGRGHNISLLIPDLILFRGCPLTPPL
jgi:hypothetical protein